MMPTTADNTRLTLTPFGKSAGFIFLILKERACRLRQSIPLSKIVIIFDEADLLLELSVKAFVILKIESEI
ncbi:hypothetical protein ES703_55144 [subsurface metagenome]